VVGVFLAAILALRCYYLMSVAAAVVFVLVALRGRRSIRGFLITAGAAAAASLGWVVALARSSGTPLFPVVLGNYNKTWPSGNDPTLSGIRAYVRHFQIAFNSLHIGWVCIVAIVIALVYLIFRAGDPIRAIVLLGAGLGCLVQMAVISTAFSGSALVDVVRFIAPSTLACGLLAMDALWPTPETQSADPSGHATIQAAHAGAPSVVLARRVLMGIPVRVALILVVAAIAFGPSLRQYAHQTNTSLHLAANVLRGSIPLPDRYAPVEGAYSVFNSFIPRGARVLAAVDTPALLDYSRYSFATLDSPGAVSPPPHMPFFQGADAKVTYLRHLGYDYIAAESPAQFGLYRFRFLLQLLRSPEYFSREQAPYNIDWQSTVTSLETSGNYEVRTSGNLSLIRIG
jgi:hypothetical protein